MQGASDRLESIKSKEMKEISIKLVIIKMIGIILINLLIFSIPRPSRNKSVNPHALINEINKKRRNSMICKNTEKALIPCRIKLVKFIFGRP